MSAYRYGLLLLPGLLLGVSSPTSPRLPATSRPVPHSFPTPPSLRPLPPPAARRQQGQWVRLSWHPQRLLAGRETVLQRSEDNIFWLDVQAFPPSVAPRVTHYDEFSPAALYRLTQLDAGGHWVYSVPVHVRAARLGPLAATALPLRRTIQLQGQDPTQPVDVLDARGQLVCQVNGPTISTAQLLTGAYILRQGDRNARVVVR